MKNLRQPPAILNWIAFILGIVAFFISIYTLLPVIQDDVTGEIRALRAAEKLTVKLDNDEDFDNLLSNVSYLNQWLIDPSTVKGKLPENIADSPESKLEFWAEEISEKLKEIVFCAKVGDCDKEFFISEDLYYYPVCQAVEDDYQLAFQMYSVLTKGQEFTKAFNELYYLETWRDLEHLCGRNPDLLLNNGNLLKLQQSWFISNQ
ncbi:hypothetical protein [Vibrio parahaemolyticus]|uniref:hypothetical protein n=1 Tax=Vibrio parahaemolyticus TaxID=670 RepID=UPI00111E1192|nr:hypothetical protein [Vibrio parahaemolyticus]TOZ82389.1 hypothetical protein DXJ95_24090 [Vibrio parahaemolyticus]